MDILLNHTGWGRKASSDERQKQITSLFIELTPHLRAVPNDDNRFQMTLHLSNNSESPLTSTPHLTRTTSSPASNNITLSYDNHPGGSAGAITGNSGQTAVMTIYLPPGFPENEPKLTIQPKVRHLWVDGTVTPCAVTHEKLMPGNWSAHTSLGKVVKEISASIQQTGVLVGSDHGEAPGAASGIANAPNINNNHGGSGYENYSHKPPPPIPGNWSKGGPGQYSNHSSPSYPPANGSHNLYTAGSSSNTSYMSSSATKENHYTQQSRSQNPTGFTTLVPPEMITIKELSPEQVEEYLENPIAFEHFFDQLQEVVGPRTTKRELWHGNDNISRRNLQLEAEMTELQQSTKDGYDVMMQLQKTLESKLQEQQDALWRFKPETIQSKLRSAAAESDELSESIAQSFLEGKLDQEGFIRQYRELRKVYHLREMKNERIGPILRKNLADENTALGRERSGSTFKGGAGVGIGLGSSTNSISGSGEGTGGSSGHGASASSAWVMV